MGARNYRDIVAWQKAMDLCQAVYELTRTFPKTEQYGLTSQIRRCAVSIPSNIAEGQGRGSDKDWARFLAIAYGSLREVETQALLSQMLGFAEKSAVEKILERAGEVGRLINGLRRSLGGE
jgi:four helix bundle protein